MPDVHWGYGFPDRRRRSHGRRCGGVVSPGGVGFDISCGVRLLVGTGPGPDRTGAQPDQRDGPPRPAIPRGMGRRACGVFRTGRRCAGCSRGRPVRGGARQRRRPRDLERCEERGMLGGGDWATRQRPALERGLGQVGSLGSGTTSSKSKSSTGCSTGAAVAMGLRQGSVCVMIHCGSRGLGHQICTDHVRRMDTAMSRYYGIAVPDRQLACTPVRSPEGEAYLAAMTAAANYRAGQPPAAVGGGASHLRGGNGDDAGPGVRHLAQHVQARGARGRWPVPHSVCASEGCDPFASAHHADLPDDLAAWVSRC